MPAPEVDFPSEQMSRMIEHRDAILYEIRGNESFIRNETLLQNVSLIEDYIFDRTDVKVIFITLYTVVFVCCFFGPVDDAIDWHVSIYRLSSQEMVDKSRGPVPREFRPGPGMRGMGMDVGQWIYGGKSTRDTVRLYINGNEANAILLNFGDAPIMKNRSNFLITGLQMFMQICNLMVIFVVSFSRRLRSITNFFLANLAVADFCVGVFCVYQTLTNYLTNSWQLGDLLCKVYMFVHALSYTASVLILVLVCVERYLAIVYPIKCRSVLTRRRLRLVVALVWLIAAIYASPRFFYVETVSNRLITGDVDIICIANIKKHNKNVLEALNLVLLYLVPLCLMTCLYSRIAIGLWRSGATLATPGMVARTKNDKSHHMHSSSRNVLRDRRGVIRMLIAVVMMFAVCNLPQQARIIWRHWDSSYDRTSDFSTLLTLSTFLISYTNSCLNPLLYAFLSRNFRKGIQELLFCKGSRRRAVSLAMGYTRDTQTRQENGANQPHSSIIRLSSVRDSPRRPGTITRQTTCEKIS